MIDIKKAKRVFREFLNKYNNDEDPGFKLKVIHTEYVTENAKNIAIKLNLSKEDVELAELIGLLHDIGRFEEITYLKEFDGEKFDHASYAVKMLFEDNLIREFIEDSSYDEIIKVAIDNHSRLSIQEGLDSRMLLHAQIIRDADKLDNFRVKIDEKIENIFPGKVRNQEEMESSIVSQRVLEKVKSHKSVALNDRKTALDYWVCVLAFVFDLNFVESFMIVKSNNYIDTLVDRFDYKNRETRDKMNEIRTIINSYVESRIK